MIVLDASAAVELLLNTPAGRSVAACAADPDETLHAPHLMTAEVTHALRRHEALATVTPERAGAALADLMVLEVKLYDHSDLLGRVWSLRHNLTAYDALYVALAEVLDAPLLTLDRRLAVAPGHGAKVQLVEA